MKEKKGIIITVAVAVIVLGVLAYALASRQKANEPKTTGNRETVKTTETAVSESAVSPAAVVTEETPAKTETVIRAIIWPEPFNFEVTPDEKKHHRDFPFTTDGIWEAVDWLNAEHEAGHY